MVAGKSGWSNGFLDFDNDGWKDLFTANSHVNDSIDQFEAFAYRLPNTSSATGATGRSPTRRPSRGSRRDPLAPTGGPASPISTTTDGWTWW